jgi:hypothetical protein
MEEDESTNQNPVKKAEFLWISGEFHFGNSPLWSNRGIQKHMPSASVRRRLNEAEKRNIAHKKSGAIGGPGNLLKLNTVTERSRLCRPERMRFAG